MQRLFPQVRRHESSRFWFFLGLFFLVNLAQTVGLVLSEALLLARYGPSSLPASFILAALATIVGSLLYALGVHQSKNDRYFIHLLGGLAGLTGLAWLGLRQDAPGIPYLLVCLYFLSQCILTNHYWTFTGDFFDTLAAKRLFPLFVVGSSLGGMVGAFLLTMTGGLLSPENQLLLWPAFLIAAMALIRVCRRPLRRWGPLELEEADETSLNEMRNAAKYLRQSSLGKQLVWSCSCMILVGFIGQYLYSSVFLRSYPKPEQLTNFLATLLTVTNFLEILVEVLITPWVIRSLGVANANQLHSLLTCLSFLGICVHPGLASAIALRFTRESLENAVAAPVRSLVYNALPARSRGRVRAFLEGLVTYAAMAVAGALLWLAGSADQPPPWMFVLGLVCAVLYAGSNWAVRRSYLRTLIEEVQAGRLDLDELSGGFTGSEVQRLRALWSDLCAEAGAQPDPALLRLAQTLGTRAAWAPLMQAAAQEDLPAWLRCACLRALDTPAWPTDWELLQKCARQPSPELRLASLQAVPTLGAIATPGWLLELVSDSHPEVRALACLLVLSLAPERSQEARAGLLEMLASPQVPLVMAALRRTPASLADELLQRCDVSSGRITRSALLRLAELPPHSEQQRKHWLRAGLTALERREPPVRRAALQLLSSHRYLLPADPDVWARLARHLEEPSKATRDLAVSLLMDYPFELGPLLRGYLDSSSGPTARAAVLCLAQSPRKDSRETLHQLLREQVYRLWIQTLVRQDLPEAGPLQRDFLLLCLDNATERSRRLVFDVLAGLETPKVIRSVEKVLRFTNLRARADALEVLSNLGDREAAQLLVLLLEHGEMPDKLGQLPAGLRRQASWKEFAQAAWLAHDHWLQRAVAWIALNPSEQEATLEEETVERLLVLRKVPLFAQMSLEQLIAIDERLEEVQYLAGEVVFEEGQLGAELYILLDGGVKIVKALGSAQELLLTRLEGVNYFGEMAILDDEPRSASVVVERNSRLLVLKGEQLKDLVEQMPEMAFEIIKVLTHRIRLADERLARTKS